MLEHAWLVKNKENKTALAEHAITYKRNFDFNKAKISDFENNLQRLCFWNDPYSNRWTFIFYAGSNEIKGLGHP